MSSALTDRVAELTRTRIPFVTATVVRASKPTSSRPGDAALLLADGEIEGFVGGTCAEASVREFGLRALSTRQPLLLRIVPGEPSQSAPDEGSVTVSNPCLSGGAMEIFLQPRLPAPRIVVVGDTPVARALATIGPSLDFAVELVDGDDLPTSAARSRPDDAALVVASHGRGEEPALAAALQAGVGYVALVASRKRGAAVVASLDVDDALRARVDYPAGLDIGARTASEVALSILAQLVQERASRRGSANDPATPPPPATVTDPVCGMSVVAVEASPQVTLDGMTGAHVTFWFCGPGCRDAFLADPPRYAARG